ncbi:AcrR family transcriptional regulator [Thermocatellispora tengchongensis]|uniref:AcrR family transcriptional regulator n=1 Tax=Thermocatellispora tengchongensis TaxID=1073253 RepID=A0A840NUT2_9ACTN|nr:TetR/AcrR family transcriptional regulator [Thermocatellispora tengchongensis]MBB5131002.1 AcrR family transcriptional regulator [Thermocatellispora tengchongensis]
MDDTRSRLIESARRLLREGGLEAVTLRAVGDAAGVSRTAPYRHFADKNALLAALAARIILDLTRHVTDAAMRETGKKPRLRALYAAYVEYAMAHREEYRLVFASHIPAAAHPELERAIEGAMELLGLQGGAPASPAEKMAVLCAVHGLADMATTGHLDAKGITAEEVIRAMVG